MKNVINIISKFFFPLFLALFIVACEKDKQDTFSQKNDDINFISSLGFDTTGITAREDYYIVEGDIMLRKDCLFKYEGSESSGTRLKQARVNSLLSYSNQDNITVRVDNSIPTSGDDNWRNEIQQAISAWNSIYNSSINFIYTTASSADITISDDLDGNGKEILNDGTYNSFTLAQASWPINGNAGPTIIINLDAGANRTFTSSQKKYNIVHELGHCIGLRHTNWNGLGESTGIGISGTPNTGTNPDPNSVMNGNTALNSWNGFSTYDIVALQNLYPSLNVVISGPKELYDCPQFATYTANASHGTGTYTYYWEISFKSSNYTVWSYLGSNKTYSNNWNNNGFFRLRVTVNSGNETKNAIINVDNTCGGGNQ